MEEDMNAAIPPPPPPILQNSPKEQFWNRFLPYRSPQIQRRVPVEISEQATIEYPSRVNLDHHYGQRDDNQSEVSPLLSTTSYSDQRKTFYSKSNGSHAINVSNQYDSVERERAFQVSAIFLRDYERTRPPTLPHNMLLTDRLDYLLMIHKWKYSLVWQVMIHLAMVAFLMASCYEGYTGSVKLPFALNMYAIVVFGMDIILLQELVNPTLKGDDPHRYSRAYQWTLPLSVLLFLLSCEMSYILLFLKPCPRFLMASFLKPICIFYVSDKARQALEALQRIAPIVLKVLGIELLLILSFAAVAAHLYAGNDSFRNLSTAWLSLFQCEYMNALVK
jgi:hypothetical protein